MKKISIALLALIGVLFLVKNHFKRNLSEVTVNEYKFEKKGPGAAHPGWLEQWKAMKANEDGIIPSGMYSQWQAADKSKAAYKRGGSPDFESVLEIGPSNVGGRTRDLIFDLSNPDRILAGAISGGLWESLNSGRTWTNHNDWAANLNITCIVQNPLNYDVFYYGTGEGIGNSSGAPGEGIFKSTDGGQTFEQLPSTLNESFEYIWDIAHDPLDTHSFYVATRSNGLFKTIDGGTSFIKVFNASSHIYDVEVLPDGGVMFGLNASGIYYSENGDLNTFTKLTKGLPSGGFHRVEIEYADTFPNVIFALFGKNVNSYDGTTIGIYKSSNGGKSWKYVGNPAESGENFGFTWYTMALGVDPDDTTKLVAGSAGFCYSTNGGVTWRKGNDSHADYHAFLFHPEKTGIFLAANDGGIYEYNWATIATRYIDWNKGYNVTQFYAGSYHPTQNLPIGGTQDNGTQMSINGGPEHKRVWGGDGAFCHIDQQNPKTAYVSSQNGNIRKTNDISLLAPQFGNVKNELDADFDGSIDDGAWFINPYEMNYLNSTQLFFPTRRRLFVSFDGAGSWRPVTNFKLDMYAVGIPNSPNPERVFVGGANLMLWRVDDPFSTEPGKEVNLRNNIPSGLASSFVANIKVHPRDDNSIFLALSNYSIRPRIWRVDDVLTDNVTWVDISGDLPSNLPVNWVEVDPYRPDSVFYAATDFGLYYTTNGGENWLKEDRIPNVSIHQIRLRASDRKLFIYTHGRGIWSADLKEMDDPFIGINYAEKLVNKISVFPNPTTATIQPQIDLKENAPFQVFDLNGKLVLSGNYSGNVINVQSLNAGTYIFKLNEGSKIHQAQFVVQ